MVKREEEVMAYQIQFITDSRFKGTRKKLVSMDKRLKNAIKKLDGVSLRENSGIRKVTFSIGVRNTQWRKSYIISKKTREVTWNQIMGKINKIQAPFYKRVKR